MTDDEAKSTTFVVPNLPSVSSTTAIMAVVFDASRFNYIQPADDHPIYALIGRVAAEWSHLEHELDRIIWALLKVISSEGACVTAQLLGATPRYKTIIAQLTLRAASEPEFKEFISRVNALMQQSYEPQEKRNRIVHDAWYFDTKRDQPAQFRTWPQKDLRFGINPVDFVDIEAALASIKKLAGKIKLLSDDIFAAVTASKQKLI